MLDHVREVSEACFGNPGSPHGVGRKARQILEDARECVASLLHATPDGVVFTSGATEASNLALYGLARGQGMFAATAAEHPATEEVLADLVAHGWRRHTLALDPQGRVREADLPAELRLFTLIYAHNETGVVQDVEFVRTHSEQCRVPWHLDATQAIGKIAVDFRELGCTTLSFAAHKFHGPRGIGCLIARPGVKLPPRNVGGHQEGGRRAGTEAVALAAGLANALELAVTEMDVRITSMRNHRDLFEQRLLDAIPDVIIHGGAANRLPNTSCIAFPGCDGQALLVALDLAGVCCSMGSACASGSPEPAPVLLAMGVDETTAKASLRFSLSHETRREDVEAAANLVIEVVRRGRD